MKLLAILLLLYLEGVLSLVAGRLSPTSTPLYCCPIQERWIYTTSIFFIDSFINTHTHIYTYTLYVCIILEKERDKPPH